MLGAVGNHTNARAALAFLLAYTPFGGVGVKYLLDAEQALVPGSAAELAALRVEALARINQGRFAEAEHKAKAATAMRAGRNRKSGVRMMGNSGQRSAAMGDAGARLPGAVRSGTSSSSRMGDGEL